MTSYQQLINMGFEDDVALIAAQKYGNDLEQCMQFIAEQEEEEKSVSEEPQTDTDPDSYKQRIDELLDALQRYEEEEEKEPEKDVHDVIAAHYEKHGGLSAFVHDQSEYVSELSLSEEYAPQTGNGRACSHRASVVGPGAVHRSAIDPVHRQASMRTVSEGSDGGTRRTSGERRRKSRCPGDRRFRIDAWYVPTPWRMQTRSSPVEPPT